MFTNHHLYLSNTNSQPTDDMSLLFWYSLALLIILIWTVAVMAIWSKWKDAIEKRNFTIMGPFVMWKTEKGKKLIEKVAETRGKWVERYGRIAVGITGVSMVTMTGFLFLSAYLVIEKARHLNLEPHMLLGLPGLNPLIPLWYGIFALVIAMMVHEFSHGILSALAKVKIISLGVMFFVFPMGAFVEPDEEAILSIEKKKRVRMYSAGPASNIILAGVFTVIFSVILMSCVQPVTDGVGITSVGENTAAEIAGIEEGMIMVSFNNTTVVEYMDFSNAIANCSANQTVEIEFYGASQPYPVTLTDKGAETNESEDSGLGYLGVNTFTLSTDHFHPIGESKTLGEFGRSMAVYFTLPLSGLSTVQGPMMDFYEIDGFWSFLPENVFWIIANTCYWVFWLNLMVGLSNALPAVPLDGGYIFKDWLDSYLKRSKKYQDEEKRTGMVNRVALTLAFMVLFLILWQVIGPRVVPLF